MFLGQHEHERVVMMLIQVLGQREHAPVYMALAQLPWTA